MEVQSLFYFIYRLCIIPAFTVSVKFYVLFVNLIFGSGIAPNFFLHKNEW